MRCGDRFFTTFFPYSSPFAQQKKPPSKKNRCPHHARIDALVKFALRLVQQRGTVDAAAVDALRTVGFDDRRLVEIPLVVSAILLTNMVNRINDTTLDFPKVA